MFQLLLTSRTLVEEWNRGESFFHRYFYAFCFGSRQRGKDHIFPLFLCLAFFFYPVFLMGSKTSEMIHVLPDIGFLSRATRPISYCVCWSIGRSIPLLLFRHYCPCPTARDIVVVYTALLIFFPCSSFCLNLCVCVCIFVHVCVSLSLSLSLSPKIAILWKKRYF